MTDEQGLVEKNVAAIQKELANVAKPTILAAWGTLIEKKEYLREYLIDQGADVHATDIDGKKPLDCTYDEEAKRILRDAMVATSNASIARTLGDS